MYPLADRQGRQGQEGGARSSARAVGQRLRVEPDRTPPRPQIGCRQRDLQGAAVPGQHRRDQQHRVLGPQRRAAPARGRDCDRRGGLEHVPGQEADPRRPDRDRAAGRQAAHGSQLTHGRGATRRRSRLRDLGPRISPHQPCPHHVVEQARFNAAVNVTIYFFSTGYPLT